LACIHARFKYVENHFNEINHFINKVFFWTYQLGQETIWEFSKVLKMSFRNVDSFYFFWKYQLDEIIVLK
jgi:hypothetical protein